MTLPAKFRQALKARAHSLHPIVLIGSQGLTPAVHQEIERALTDHELIKIRIATTDRELKQAVFQAISQAHEADLIQSIGHIGVFYRKQVE